MNTYRITKGVEIIVSGEAEDLLIEGKFKDIAKDIKALLEKPIVDIGYRKIYRCENCSKIFKKRKSLNTHTKKFHADLKHSEE